MNEMEIRKKLYEKMEKEFRDFIEEMKSNEPEVIVNSAYQIVIKEELVAMFYPESKQYDIDEIKALNKTKNPLEELYQGWMDSDAGIQSVLEDNISDTIEEIQKEQREKKKDRER
ncbi:MAG: DUF3848 domain-containing protein [Clostridia bacterium]|nr:DUF3848 domain-containing protein [Clostridia bacterium]